MSFINTARTLSSYFRRVISGHLPCELDVTSATADIGTWLFKDVKLLSEMTMDAMNELFSALVKYDDRWNEIFAGELPDHLKQLKVKTV